MIFPKNIRVFFEQTERKENKETESISNDQRIAQKARLNTNNEAHMSISKALHKTVKHRNNIVKQSHTKRNQISYTMKHSPPTFAIE